MSRCFSYSRAFKPAFLALHWRMLPPDPSSNILHERLLIAYSSISPTLTVCQIKKKAVVSIRRRGAHRSVLPQYLSIETRRYKSSAPSSIEGHSALQRTILYYDGGLEPGIACPMHSHASHSIQTRNLPTLTTHFQTILPCPHQITV